MNKNKIIIIVLVIFIALVALIALGLKYQAKPASGPSSATTDVSGDGADNSSASPAPVITQTADGKYVDGDGNIREVDTSVNDALPVFVPPTVASIETTGPSLSAMPGSAAAPKQDTVKNNDIPAQAIRIDMAAAGFNPKEFRVRAGAEVTLALSASDDNTHIFIFPNSSLMGLTTMVLGGETKTLTFNAPKAGVYDFRDDMPDYRANTGQMIVE